MKKQLLTLFILISFSAAFGQVGINTTAPEAQLDIRSSNQATPSNTDGILIPKIDVFPAVNPTATQNGMMVFLTTTVGIKPPGFYYWDSTTSSWIGLAASTSGWALTGNSGTVAGTNFIGTTDNQGLDFRTNNIIRGRFTSAGFLGIGTTTPNQQLELTENFRLPVSTSTTGIIYAGTFRFAHNLGGTYFGTNAGNLVTTSSWNTGIGQNVMQSQTTGNFNVGVGATALSSSTGGFSNSAVGYQALNGLTTGGDNTAMGSSVMRSLTTGSRNIAIGSQAMIGSATNSSDNVAMGYGALAGNGVSFFNTAIGSAALNATSTGANNTAIGRSSMQSNTTGSRNTTLGYSSLFSGLTTTNNTAIGYEAGRDVTGSGNVMLGYQAGYSEAGSNKLYIDNSNTASPLVYGDFNTNLLRVNGTLNINNTYSFPTTDGTAGQVLATNGAGLVSWTATSAESDPNAWLKGGNAGTTAGTNFLGTTDATDFVFKTNNTERARILSTGFMGIGVNAPSAYLDINGNNGAANSLLLRSGNNNNDFGASQIAFSWNGGSDYKHSIKSRHNAFGDSGNAIDFVLWDQGTDGISAMGTKKVMTIDGDGNGKVGIGTVSPAKELEVVGEVRTSSLAGTGTRMVQADNNGTLTPLTAGTASQVLLGTGVWGSVPGITNDWSITGNAGTVPGTNFIGTTDNQAIDFRTNNVIKTRFTTKGQIETLNTGNSVFVGEEAGANDDLTNNFNVNIGYQAGKNNNTGTRNVSIGHQALTNNTSNNNVAIGSLSLTNSTTASDNIALGTSSLTNATTGGNNIAIGTNALSGNTTGLRNVALGSNTLGGNNGNLNVGIGDKVLAQNNTGTANTAIGAQAMFSNQTGGNNVAVGFSALINNISGIQNTAVGFYAGQNATGTGNVFLGNRAGSFETGNSKLYIANSNTTSPLIYGDFGAALLRVNGTLNINNTYSLPTTDGTAGQTLTTDGAGVVSWSNAAVDNMGNHTATQNVQLNDNYLSNDGDNEGLRIDNNGNVGIGTATPAEELEVVGDIRTSSLAGTGTRMVQADTNGTLTPLTAGTVSQVLLGTGVWGNVPGITNDWSITGNTGTVPGTNFIGTTDNQAIDFRTNNTIKTRLTTKGQIETLNTGQSVFLGESAGASDDLSSNRNVFIGYNAGMTNTTGADNIALGYNSLGLNTTGFNNVAAGPNALYINTTGFSNAAFGGWALMDNTTGRENTAIGVGSMSANTTGIQNTAVGVNGLNSNITGNYNVSVGAKGMDNNIDGINNVAVGYSTLMANTSGSNNTAVGRTALNGNTTGSNNTAIGYLADVTSPSLTNASAIGYNAKVNASNSMVLGGTGIDAVKVGIGTTTPAKELEVIGEVRTSSLTGTGTRIVQADTNGTLTPLTAGTSSQVLLGTGIWGSVPGLTNNWSLNGSSGTTAGTNFIGTTDAVDFVLKTNNTERMRVLSAGNVGIGTTSPAAPLDVNGSGMFSSTTANSDLQFNTVTRSTIYPNGANTPANLAIQLRSKGSGVLELNSDNIGNIQMVTGGGNVGIGTATPTQAKVVINGTQNNTLSYGFLNSGGSTGTVAGGTAGFSLYASGRIAATEFNAFSDERIKNIKGISNSSKDLETLNKIQITDYTFKDSIGKGTGTNKKVIAQQVQKVYPQAVSEITDVIPDIYTLAKIKDGRVILKNTLQKGDRVKLVFDNRTELVTVLQADEFGFNVAAKDEGKVFVFGREVKDFHTVDYEALSTLNISATQELIKIINQQEVQIRGLKADNTEINNRLSQTEKDIDQIKSMFNNTVSSNSK